jgi:hypothetical protein
MTAYTVHYTTYPSARAAEARTDRMTLTRQFRTRRAAERFLNEGDRRHTSIPVEPFGEVEETAS